MPTCKVHPDTELICPKCRAAAGGVARAKSLSKTERSRIAKLAVQARERKRQNRRRTR
jgi:hypothetical protein